MAGNAKRPKDEVLYNLGSTYNVARFASFAPDLSPRFARLSPTDDAPRSDLEASVAVLMAQPGVTSVNVRTFLPHNPQTTGFAYGLKSRDEALATVRRFAADGLYTIVNETIDVNDGGVSGVVMGDLVEFAPGDTPRCVEKPGTASLPRAWAQRILKTVYGIDPPFHYAPELRIEFSLHPLVRGVRREHAIVWEAGTENGAPAADPRWPNRFSKHVGDKVYGLLIADTIGLPVPLTTSFPRRIAPFSFGRDTGSAETWLRTCPNEQTPGKFTTCRGWTDPYRLMADEDPEGKYIGSILAQAGIRAQHSGACITGVGSQVFIEGRAGFGDGFMQGTDLPEEVPADVRGRIEAMYAKAHAALGAVRFEWVDDGQQTWIVQLHKGATQTSATAIVEGEAQVWHDFDASQGLEALRGFVSGLSAGRDGIRLHGRVGLTSHIADVIRKSGIPTRIA